MREMPWLLLILLLSSAYVGCAARAELSGPSPTTRSGGEVRILAGLQREGFLKSVVAAPLTPGALAASSSAPRTVGGSDEAGGGCWSFAIDPHARFPDGSPVRPADLVTAWETGLREPASAHRWLLRTVEGSEALAATRATGLSGLRPVDDRLEVCVSTTTPDLPQRLSHPALWLWRRAEPDGMWEGPGPFRQITATRLEANPAGEMPPLLDAVQLVDDPATDPALLLNLAEADLGVVFGRAAERLRHDARENLSLTRLPRWDRVYFLWVDRGARWVNDPRFRRWLAGAIDRQSIVDYLFAGQGEPVQTLSGTAVADREPLSKPLERLSRPRLSLVFDEADPLAARIAGRLVAAVRLEAIDLSLISRGADELRSSAGDPAPSIILSVHQPWSDDPVLGLIESLWPPAGPDSDTIKQLERASRIVAADHRLDAAGRIEQWVIDQGELIPLVRLHAWLAVDARLREVGTGPPGVLRLQEAWWFR